MSKQIENGIVHVKRANIDGIYKVPKETSRTRDLELLDEAIDILIEQKKYLSTIKNLQLKNSKGTGEAGWYEIYALFF